MATESEKQTDYWREQADKSEGQLAQLRIDAWQMLNENAEMRAMLERYKAGEEQFAALHDQEMMDVELYFDVEHWLKAHPKEQP